MFLLMLFALLSANEFFVYKQFNEFDMSYQIFLFVQKKAHLSELLIMSITTNIIDYF